MPYSNSYPLGRWLGPRHEVISALAIAHTRLGDADGLGKHLATPLAHAYVLRMVAEFQAFVRDLHDLAAARLVGLSNASTASQVMLIAAVTEGRMIDRANADLRSWSRTSGAWGSVE